MNSAKAAVIDVWDFETFDPELVHALKAWTDLIVTYWNAQHQAFLDIRPGSFATAQGNVHGPAYQEVCDVIASLMRTRSIRGFHYTRLTDHEAGALREVGIYLSTPAKMLDRLDAMVSAGCLTSSTASQLFKMSPINGSAHVARTGRFCLLSHPKAIEDGGVTDLLKYWGGEAISIGLKDASLLELLSHLGKPRILEVEAPISATTKCDSACDAVIATFAHVEGAVVEETAYPFHIVQNLPPSAVIAIHTEGEATFSAIGKSYPLKYRDLQSDIGFPDQDT